MKGATSAARAARTRRVASGRRVSLAHERQAERAARSFVRHGADLGRQITPAPAAAFLLPGSAGMPLAASLRRDLESAFSADFSAVRVHTDAAAWQAARGFGAEAFTSGTHVYFAHGCYRPDTPEGLSLIAHEVSHVLQQAGRPGSGGRVAGSTIVGTGPVQCSGSGSTPEEIEAQKEAFDATARLHAGSSGPSGDADLDRAINAARELLDGRLWGDHDKPAWAQKFENAAHRFDGKSAKARSFIFDCLKALGFFKKAAGLAESDEDFKLRTLGGHDEFFDYLLHDAEFGRGRLSPFLAHKAFEKLWPATVLRSWRRYFLHPRIVPAIDPLLITQLRLNLVALQDGAGQSPPKLRTEMYWATWRLIGELEDERVHQNGELRARLLQLSGQRSIHETLVEQIPFLRRDEQKLLEDPSTPEYQRVIANGKIEILDEVLPIWKAALASYGQWQRRFESLGPDELLSSSEIADLPDSSPIRDTLAPLRAPLVSAARALFQVQLDAEGRFVPIRADEYAQRLFAFQQAIGSQPFAIKKKGEPYSLLGHVDAFLEEEAMSARRDEARLAAFALTPLIVGGVLGLAFAYDAAKDQKSPSFADMREAHRVRLARRLAFLGRWLHWDDLTETVSAVLRDEEDPDIYEGLEPTLYLVSDWEPDKSRPISHLLSDFPANRNTPIVINTPFTASHLVEWYRYRYHSSLRQTMEEILRYEDFLKPESPLDFSALERTKQTTTEIRETMAPSAEAEVALAPEAVKQFPLKVPQRFIVEDYELLVPPGTTVNWFDLLSSHRKSQLQFERRAPYVLFPNKPEFGAFAWALPPLDDLFAVMREIPSIARLAKEHGIPEAKWLAAFSPPENREGEPADDEEIKNITLTAAEWSALNTSLLQWLQRLGEHQVKQLPDLRRRLVILRRRWLMMNLKPLISHFAEYPYVSHGPIGESDTETTRRLNTPVTAIRAIYDFERFARSIQIDSDDPTARAAATHAGEVQTALLIIGLSPSLLKLRLGTIDGDFKRHLYGFYQLAIDYVSDPQTLAELKAGVGVTDEVAYLVFSADRLQTMKTEMQSVMRAIEKELEESQKQRGYRSEDGKSILPNARLSKLPVIASKKPDPLYEWRIGQQLGVEGELDETTGVLYRLVDVYRKFEFHPRAGSPPVAGVRAGMGGPYSPAWIIVDGTRYDEPNLPDLELFKIRIGDQETIVKANDLVMLDAMDEIFLWRAFSLALEQTAEHIETFAQWMITVVSFFVPEVAMAEFVLSVARMIATKEFEDLVHQLKGDPIEIVRKVIGKLTTELFKPEKLLIFLLLGGQHSPWGALTSLSPERQRKVKATPRTRFGRLAASLRALGGRFRYALDRMRDYFRPPLRRVQGRIAMHPTLTWLLRRAAHFVQMIADIVPLEEIQKAKAKDEPLHPPEFAALLHADRETIDRNFRERIKELFEGIETFELPGELVDLALATELIVSFLLDRFGPRGKIVRMLLQVTPVPDEWFGKGGGGYRTAMAALTGEIAKVWRGTPLDPNEIWRNDLMPQIEPNFTQIRDKLVTGMYDLVDALLQEMGLPKLDRPKDEDLPRTKVVPEPLLEAEAALGQRARPTSGRMRLTPTGGTPLGAPLRERLQQILGADLSHVRLHPGASSATAALGADAVTSGSHIFLSPQAPTTGAAGNRLIAHETTHVVQQTGAQGPAGTTMRTPTLGRPAAGVRIDPDREAAADLVSREVEGGRHVSVRLRQELGRASGVQPSLGENVVESVLETLSTTKPTDFTRDLEGGRTPEGWAEAKKLADALFAKVKQIETIEFATFLKDTTTGENIPKLVQTYLRELTDKFPEIELKRIAALGQKPRRKKQKDEADTELNRKGFIQLLGNYIYANRHVALAIDTDVAVTRINKLHVFNLNLAEVGGTAKFWGLAMKASFKGNTTVTDLEKAQREIRQRLRLLPGNPSIWDSKRFRFAQWLIDEYVALLKARALGRVADVPPFKEYAKPTSQKPDALAVSTHGDLTTRGIGAFDRESHHTTQYLLVEFFGNHPNASARAFPEPFEDFTFPPAYKDRLGLDPTSGRVDHIKGTAKLDIKPLNPTSGRGEGMPTILLSARCHQRGNLHILRETRWVDNAAFAKEMHGTATQGLAIENTFNRAIATPDLRPRDTSEEHRRKLRAKIKAEPLDASQQYYRAALTTYRWMRERMIPALKTGLLTEEKAYYRGIAAREHSESEDKLHKDWDLQDAALLEVYDAAVTQNDTVMGKHHWTAE